MSFDENFKKIENLNYLPWIGKSYSNASIKLMVVGESVYDWQDEDDDSLNAVQEPDYVRNLVANQAIKNPNRFFSGVNHVLFGEEDISLEKREKLWETAVYIPLVQRYMSSTKERPNTDDFKQGLESFFKLVDILEPTHCLFCGKMLMKHYEKVRQKSIYKDSDKPNIHDYDQVIINGTSGITASLNHTNGNVTWISVIGHR